MNETFRAQSAVPSQEYSGTLHVALLRHDDVTEAWDANPSWQTNCTVDPKVVLMWFAFPITEAELTFKTVPQSTATIKKTQQSLNG